MLIFMKIDTILSEIGLNGNKGAVYIAALEIGTGTVQDIAKVANLPRTTVHGILLHLHTLGLLSVINRGRTKIFTAESPEKLKTLLKEKERQIDSVMPELLLLRHISDARPRVRFYEGLAGVKTVFEDTLTVKNKFLMGVLSMEDLFKFPGKDFMDDYTKRRVEAGIKLHVVRSEVKEVEEAWPSSKKENRELHYAPSSMVFPMTMYLYDQKVGIIGTQKEMFGMIIESADFFQTQKNLFDVIWQVSKVGKRID